MLVNWDEGRDLKSWNLRWQSCSTLNQLQPFARQLAWNFGHPWLMYSSLDLTIRTTRLGLIQFCNYPPRFATTSLHQKKVQFQVPTLFHPLQGTRWTTCRALVIFGVKDKRTKIFRVLSAPHKQFLGKAQVISSIRYIVTTPEENMEWRRKVFGKWVHVNDTKLKVACWYALRSCHDYMPIMPLVMFIVKSHRFSQQPCSNRLPLHPNHSTPCVLVNCASWKHPPN